MSLEDAGRARVAPYVSSPTDPVYIVTGLPEETIASAFASDVGGDLRSVLAQGASARGGVGADHAAIHLVMEGVSRVAASAIVDLRPGACALRSGPIDRRSHVAPAGISPELAARYSEGLDRLLGAYIDLLPRVVEALRVRSPPGSMLSSSEHDELLREHAEELLRGLLPASLTTRLALTTDALSLSNLIAELASHPLGELRAVGAAAARAAAYSAPNLVRVGLPSAYRTGQRTAVSEALRLVYTPPADGVSATMVITQPVRLLRHDKDTLERIALALVYDLDPRAHAYGLVDGLRHATAGELEGLVKSAFAGRAPGDPPPRALDAATMTFELMLDVAAYGDLVQTRVSAPATQRFTCRLGFDTPSELADLGLVEVYQDTLIAAYDTWAKLEASHPLEAQYAVPLGYRTRTLWTLTLRELFDVVEQSSARRVHPSCRRIAHGLYRAASGALPWLRDLVRVDLEGSSRA